MVAGVADGAGAEVKREGVGLLKMLVGRGNELWNKDYGAVVVEVKSEVGYEEVWDPKRLPVGLGASGVI